MAIIELQENESVDEITVVIGSHISVTYYNHLSRSLSRPDLHPYSREGFAEVKRHAERVGMFQHVGTKSDYVWSAIPF